MKLGNAKSIRASLKRIADKENLGFMLITTRYFHERLLYRIAKSEYKDIFFLKGGALLYAIEGLHVRPTVDIDLLAKQISNDQQQIKHIFHAICSMKFEDDGVIFDINGIETSDISEEAKYSGVRVLIYASLDTIKQRLQIDIGFSDIITPAPVNLQFPSLLHELPKVEINAYSIETIIAEKFHAMIDLGTLNSRMKDFYDVYMLLKNNDINTENLKTAVLNTFKQRNSNFLKEHEIFSISFYENAIRLKLWKSFLRKIKFSGELEFPHVVISILEKLQPIYYDLSNQLSINKLK